MDFLEATSKAACVDGKIPGAVVAAADQSGSFIYSKAFGVRALDEGKQLPCETDTLMALFSSTKLVTTIAALQLVERGRISLDGDTAALLPELAELPVLTRMEDGKGVLVKRRNPITLRHLLTHSSGLCYTFMSPLLQDYNASLGLPAFAPPKTVVESYSTPLVFEPGTCWTYGTGLDWVGLLVSRISGMDVQSYFQRNICAPLAITDLTFWPAKHPELLDRMASLSIRDPSVPGGAGKAMPFKGPNILEGAKEEMAGQGLFTSMPSYLKILHSLLLDDEKLLKKETTAMMFEPQLTEQSREALQAVYKGQPATGPCSIGKFPPNVPYDWGLGGLLTTQDVNEDGMDWRKKGCLNWSGMPNLFWFVDRAAGVCGMYGGQLMPAGDKQVKALSTLFEKTVYEQMARKAVL